jgi:hypothetical protein
MSASLAEWPIRTRSPNPNNRNFVSTEPRVKVFTECPDLWVREADLQDACDDLGLGYWIACVVFGDLPVRHRADTVFMRGRIGCNEVVARDPQLETFCKYADDLIVNVMRCRSLDITDKEWVQNCGIGELPPRFEVAMRPVVERVRARQQQHAAQEA